MGIKEDVEGKVRKVKGARDRGAALEEGASAEGEH